MSIPVDPETLGKMVMRDQNVVVTPPVARIKTKIVT